jgi:hypothetical protein
MTLPAARAGARATAALIDPVTLAIPLTTAAA